jgi:hypothetical protein
MRLLAVLLLAAGTLFAAPSPATGDTHGCVTRAEFSRAHNGMTRARVHRILGTAGRRVSFHVDGDQNHEARDYRACRHPRSSLVSLRFNNGRLSGKAAIWG